MSVQALSWARVQRVGDTSAKAILRSLADQANADGVCWPGVDSICVDTELSRATVQRKLRLLESIGLIECIERPGKSTLYRLQLGVSIAIEPVQGASQGGGPHAATGSTSSRKVPHAEAQVPHGEARTVKKQPEANLEPSDAARQKVRKPDRVWEALVAVFGLPTNDAARQRRNRAVKLVRQSLKAGGFDTDDAGAVLAEVRRRARRWPKRYESATLTDSALANRWDELAGGAQTAGASAGAVAAKCPECDVAEGKGHAAGCSRAEAA